MNEFSVSPGHSVYVQFVPNPLKLDLHTVQPPQGGFKLNPVLAQPDFFKKRKLGSPSRPLTKTNYVLKTPHHHNDTVPPQQWPGRPGKRHKPRADTSPLRSSSPDLPPPPAFPPPPPIKFSSASLSHTQIEDVLDTFKIYKSHEDIQTSYQHMLETSTLLDRTSHNWYDIQQIAMVNCADHKHCYAHTDPRFHHRKNSNSFVFDVENSHITDGQTLNEEGSWPVIASTFYVNPKPQSLLWKIWSQRNSFKTYYLKLETDTTKAMGPYCFHYLIHSQLSTEICTLPAYRCLWCPFQGPTPPPRFLFAFTHQNYTGPYTQHVDFLKRNFPLIPFPDDETDSDDLLPTESNV